MKKNSASKQCLLFSAATISLLAFGHTREAYAACTLSGGIYTCSGTTSGSTDGFSLTNSVNGDPVNVAVNDTVIGSSDNGIVINNTVGSVTAITLANGVTVAGGTTGIKIDKGGNSTTSISIGSGATVGGGNTGIRINNAGSSGEIDITIGSGAIVEGTTTGIMINNAGINAGKIDISGTLKSTIGFSDALAFSNLANDFHINLHTGAQITGGGSNQGGNITDSMFGSGYSHLHFLDDYTTNGNFLTSDFDIASGKTLSLTKGNSITVDTMTAGSGGTIEFNVEDPNANSFGTVYVNGGAINLTGLTLKVNVTGNAIVAGTNNKMLIMDGAATIIGGPGGTRTTIADNSSLWNFKIVDGTDADAIDYATNTLFTTTDDTDLWLIATANASSFSTIVLPVRSDVGMIIDTLRGDGGGSIQLINMINTLGTYSGSTLTNAITSLTPDTSGANTQAAQAVSDAALGTVESHFESNFGNNSNATSGNPLANYTPWVKAFGTYINQGTRDGQAGYSGKVGGMTFGADTDKIFEDTQIGLAFSYAVTSVDSDSVNNTKTLVDSYGLTAYGQHKIGNGFFINGLASYMLNQNDTARHNIGGSTGPTGYGDFNSHAFSTRVEAGRKYNIGGVSVTPALLAGWNHVYSESYSETGAGGLGLDVDSISSDKLDVGAKIRVARSWKDDEGNIATPAIKLGYSYDVIGDQVDTTASFVGGGSAFSTQGVDPARGNFNGGLGFKYETTGNLDFEASYDLNTKEDYTAHSASIKATAHF